MRRLVGIVAAAAVLVAGGRAAGAGGQEEATAIIQVKGLICSSCSEGVRKALSRLTGVGGVTVNIRDDTVQVRYDSTKITPRQMVEAIRKAGYEARLPAAPAGRKRPR